MTPDLRAMVLAIAHLKPGTIAEWLASAAEAALGEGLAPDDVTAEVADRLVNAARERARP